MTSTHVYKFIYMNMYGLFICKQFSKTSVQLVNDKKANLSCNLVASWTVHVGDMDQCLHLWKYTGGFEKIDIAKEDLWHDEVILAKYI